MPISFDPNAVDRGLPRGIYSVKLESLLPGETNDGRFTLKLASQITEPDAFLDRPTYHTFYLGTKDDPTCSSDTWFRNNMSATQLADLLRAIDFPMDVMDDIESGIDVTGCELLADIGPRQGKDAEGNPRTYANNYFGFYPVGSREVGLSEEEIETPAPKKAAKSAPASKPAARTRTRKAAPNGADEEAAIPDMVNCPLCGDSIPKPDFPSHATTCDGPANDAA